MELVQYEKFYNDAMLGMDDLFEELKASMKQFNKKNYPGAFEHLMKKYGNVFLSIEEIYRYEENKEKWVRKLAERFTEHARVLIDSKRWKYQQNNLTVDCTMFVVSYVIPAIMEYQGEMSAPLAQAVADLWNESFGTQIECGNYERIYGGFRTSILGINLG